MDNIDPRFNKAFVSGEEPERIKSFFEDLHRLNEKMKFQMTMEILMMEHLLTWGVEVGPVPEMIPYYEVPTMRLRMEMPPSFVKDHPNSVILGPGERLERLTDTKTGWDEYIS